MPMYNSNKIGKTLQEQYMTQQHILSREAEFTNLVALINQNKPGSIIDIGVGDARLPIKLAKLDLWSELKSYTGIDNSLSCLDEAKTNISRAKLDEKIELIYLEAKDISSLNKTYDMAICTYFTAGNFYPTEFSFLQYGIQNKKRLDLHSNSSFESVFTSVYELLNPRGIVVLGSIYKDNPNVRQIQEHFYQQCGMQVITDEQDSFVATKEGFWSQRFTNQQIRDYFHWVPRKNIRFVPLDSNDFSEMVIINKED